MWSCQNDGSKTRGGAERIIEEERFYAVRLGLDANAVFEKGDEQKIILRGSQEALDKVKSESFKGKWRIYIEDGFEQDEVIDIKVISPGIEGLTAIGKGQVRIDGGVMTEKGHIVVREEYDVSANDITSPRMQVLHYGPGSIELKGSTRKLTTFINSTGNVDASRLEMDSLRAVVKGSGEIEVSEIQHLDAIITGVGSVKYDGDPEIKQVVRGGGKLIKK
jgi:hypothetical protein